MRKYLVLATACIVAISLAACHHGADGITGGGGGGGGSLHMDLTAFQNTVAVGGTLQLVATVRDQNNAAVTRTILYASSNTAVATVDNFGAVHGVAVGVITVTASTTDPTSATMSVNVVQNAVNSITLTPPTLDMRVNDVSTIVAQLKAFDGTVLTGRTVVWASDNTGVATVDQSGVVTARSPGGANITATSEGKTGTSVITVTNPPVATVQVNGSTTMFLLFNQTLTTTLRDAGGNILTGRAVTWSTSDGS
ncbi:MAG: Ig-like domain-containing protein, partial [Gemmatimonadaceae bacterium]